MLVQGIKERIRIEFLNSINTGLAPLACQKHQSATHCRNTGGIADCLAFDFLVAFLVIANIIYVIGLFLAILFTRKDTSDIRLDRKSVV